MYRVRQSSWGSFPAILKRHPAAIPDRGGHDQRAGRDAGYWPGLRDCEDGGLFRGLVNDHYAVVGGAGVRSFDGGRDSVRLLTQEETERLIQPVVDHFDRQVIGQQSLVDRFRFLSPAIVTQAALNDVAGASVARYRHFLEPERRDAIFIRRRERRPALTYQPRRTSHFQSAASARSTITT
jgi:Domain of unknown function (DUF3526)